jgi:hypothetical protein
MNKSSGKKDDNLSELLPMFDNAYFFLCPALQLIDNDLRNNIKNVPMDYFTFSIANGRSSFFFCFFLLLFFFIQ